MLSREQIEQQEEALRDRVNRLPDNLRLEYFRQAERQLKDPDTYAALNWLFIAGLHHFYLGRWLHGLINLSLFCAGIILLFAGFVITGIVIVLAVTLFELYALFNSQNIVAAYNNEVMEKICSSLSNQH